MAKIKNIHSRHIYDTPEIYDQLYNCNKGFKVNEGLAFAWLANRHQPKAKTLLEVMSGSDTIHMSNFVEGFANAKRLTYYRNDMSPSAPEDVIKANVLKDDLGYKFDIVTAHYLSMNCILDDEGYVTRSGVLSGLSNIYDHLNTGGVLIVDMQADGYRTATSLEKNHPEVRIPKEMPVDWNSSLGKMLDEEYNIDPSQTVITLKSYARPYFNRMNGNSVDDIDHIDVCLHGKVVRRYTYDQPFCVRYFSETECVDMLMEAGFGDVAFYNINYVELEFLELPKYPEYDGDEDDDFPLPNVLVAKRTRGGRQKG